jgi:hypothetical protein
MAEARAPAAEPGSTPRRLTGVEPRHEMLCGRTSGVRIAAVAAADVTGDGKPDVVVASANYGRGRISILPLACIP